MSSRMDQPYMYLHPLPLDFLPIHITSVHKVELPFVYSRFSLVFYFIHNINSNNINSNNISQQYQCILYIIYQCVGVNLSL